MRKEIAMKWADDLESGNYPQAKMALEKVDEETGETIGYCCLGVLVKGQAVPAGVVTRNFTPAENHLCYEGTDAEYTYSIPAQVDYNNAIGVLTKEVRDWADLKSCNPLFNVPGLTDEESCATQLNDNKGYTFPQIAQLIREQWETL